MSIFLCFFLVSNREKILKPILLHQKKKEININNKKIIYHSNAYKIKIYKFEKICLYITT
jgi:hypothetical protein